MPPEPLQTPPQSPPVFTTSGSSIIEDTKRLIEQSLQVQRQILENVEPDTASFANVLLPLAQSENATALESHVLIFYRSASADAELREASRQAQNLLDEASVDAAMNEGLFKLVQAVLDKQESLDAESIHFLEKRFKTHVKNGLKLPVGPLRERFRAIQSRLSQLATDFRENVAETGGLWFSPEELEGVPANALSRFEEGHGDNQGKIWVTFTPPDYYPVMRYAVSEKTRKTLFLADNNRCNQNISVFRETVILRDEAARLLGYPNHAALRIEDKMAKTPEVVDEFLDDLQSRLTEGGRQETTELRGLKRKHLESLGQTFNGRFHVWDTSYYHRLMLEEQYAVDHRKIAEYFPVETTITGMFKLVQHIFGLRIVPQKVDESHTWHPDVEVFAVWNDEELGGGFLGYLYLDLFTHDGKNSNAACFNLAPGFAKEDGTRHYPASALVCNFRKPSAGNPTLLRHDEVVVLFHELGHSLHDLVAKTTYACFHGIEVVVDFGEAPSQMLEYWCWAPSQLKALSRHFSSLSEENLAFWRKSNGEDKTPPPQRIPDELVNSLVQAKCVNGAIAQLSQISIGKFDMAVHEPTSHAAVEEMDFSSMFNKIRSDIIPMNGPEICGLGDEWGHPQTKLTHLMGEYDAGYYGYLFSKVYAADMFYTVFGEDQMDRKEGIRYRCTVLEKGGGQDEMKTLVDFLGRRPGTRPFHRELGLA